MDTKKKISPHGVIFDMDGTMFDTEPISDYAWRETAKALSLPLDERFLQEIRGTNRAYIRTLFLSRYGNEEQYEKARLLHNRFFKEYIAQSGVPLKSGLIELLTYLKEKGKKLAVATSTYRLSAFDNIERAGVASFFDAFVFGDEILSSKPAPDIFLAAAEKLGLSPADCVVVEDSPNGVRAGRASGATVIAVPDMIPIEGECASCTDFILPSLKEAVLLIE